VPCGGTLVAGSLTGGSALYTASYSYDTLDRLTSGPLGSYTYGPGQQAPTNPSPLHAALSAGSTWTASYDASGDMLCRAPTCSGTPTGAQLTYDTEGRLSGWQNTPSSPTTTDSFLYDGGGNRVSQQVTSGGSTTTTVYVGGVEENSTTGSTTTTTTYYAAAGMRLAEAVGGVFSYLATDGLGSVSEALDGSGNVTFQQLYAPYGGSRFSSGTSPTSYAYTGQRADGTSGLDYYNARYYDPVAGQFVSADTVADGLNRYGYVHGNPTTSTDPTGHLAGCIEDEGNFYCHRKGGSSDGDTGITISCRDYPNQKGCYDWRIWRDGIGAECGGGACAARKNALSPLRDQARNLILSGIVVDLIAIGVQMAKGFDLGKLLNFILVVLDTIVEALGALSSVNPDAGQQFYSLLSTATYLVGAVNGLLGVLAGLAAWMVWIIKGAFVALKVAVGGFAQLFTALAWSVVGFIVEGIAQTLVGAGFGILSDVAAQSAMPIWDWCNGPGKGKCAPEPNHGMPEPGKP
jgi:RHS repeat-associated protein